MAPSRQPFVDLVGTKLFGIDVPLAFPTQMEQFAGNIADALHGAIAASPFSVEGLSRMGIAIRAVVDSRHGVVHRIPCARLSSGCSIANHANSSDAGTVLILTDGRRLQQILNNKVPTAARQVILDGFPFPR